MSIQQVLLATPRTGAGTITYVGASSVASRDTTTGIYTVDVSVPSGVQEGDLLVMFGFRSRYTTGTSLFSLPNWTDRLNTFGTGGYMCIFTKVASSSEPSTYTLEHLGVTTLSVYSPILAQMVALRFAAVDVVGTFTTTSASDYTYATGITTSTSNALVFAWSRNTSTATYTVSSVSSALTSFTEITNALDAISGQRIFLHYGTRASAGSAGSILYDRSGGGGGTTIVASSIAFIPS